MNSFDEVGARLRRVTVNAPDYGNSHGVLSLDGDDSLIELSGDIPLEDVPPPGWFDLRLDQAEGPSIFVHNAVQTCMSFPQDRQSRSVKLFPNQVVDNAAAVGSDGRVASISFELDGWGANFAYQFVEELETYGAPPEGVRAALEGARYDFLRDDPFEPASVFVINDLGKLADFVSDGSHYQISASSRGRSGASELSVSFQLVGTITFPDPVKLGTATDGCWGWRRYFNQLAMGRMAFIGMAVAASAEPRSPRGNLYLSSEQRERPSTSDRSTDRHYMPLNQWHEREAAGEAMQSWLDKETERLVFRAALDRVLARPGHVTIEAAVALCSGIDTLPELKAKESLPKVVRDQMADAALAVAVKAGLSLERDRIRGVLGSLQNEDLRRRLKRLVQIAAPEAEDQKLVDRWIEIVISLRLSGAHGHVSTADDILAAGPAVEALAALCARFDLQSAGVPDECANGMRSLPRLRWDQSLMALKMSETDTPGA